MKIAVFNSLTLLATHYETELQIIQNHLDNGDEVTQLICKKQMPACVGNPFSEPEACERCVSKWQVGYQALTKQPKTISFFDLTEQDKQQIAAIPKSFNTIAELQKLTFSNFDIGSAVASSIISIYRDPNPSLDSALVERFIITCMGVYFSMKNYLKKNPTDVVYAFNGRFSETRAVLRACNSLNVKCLLHERGHSKHHYSLFENTTIHDLRNTERVILETWENADKEQRVELASRWYNNRISGKSELWFPFIENPTSELPSNWDPNQRNILICNSSEDEFASVGEEWKNPLYKNQLDGITRIVTDGMKLPNTHFYLRVHPNLKKVVNDDLKELMKFQSPNLTVIPADDAMNTYVMVQHADKVITFGSTMGMESTYMGKASILAGKSFYYYLGGTYNPQNHDELLELLTKDLEAKPKEIALKFGYFFGTYGTRFEHYVAEDFDKGTFNNIRVVPSLGIKYSLIKTIYNNKSFPNISERLKLRRREKLINTYLP
jgi:hypothetical protein